MKSYKQGLGRFTYFIILLAVLKDGICHEYDAVSMQTLLQAYLKDYRAYLTSHNNRQNFVAVFSNFTRLNGDLLYDQYVSKQRDMQSLMDDINNIKIRNLDKWEYDAAKRKFVLPDDSKSKIT